MRRAIIPLARRPGWPRIGIGLFLGAAVLLGGYYWYRTEAGNPSSAEPLARLGPTAFTIAPGVHMLGGLSPSAAYAVETPEGIALVDTGLQADAGALKEQMASVGLDWKLVSDIFLTHAHGDHTGGAEHLRTATGARVHAGAGDAGVLRAGGPREAFFSTFAMPDDTPHPTTIDVALEGGETIDLGGVTFHALATPGHTPGSICYLVERSGLRILFAGDVISMLLGDPASHSRFQTPLGTYSAYLAPRYRGDAVSYLASLRRLRALEVPNLILPGHPREDPSPQDPRLTQARWHELLDRGIRDMEALAGRLQKDGADFLDGEPKTLMPGLLYLGDRGGRAVYALSTASKLFLVDAPGGPGLLDFVQERLRRLGLEPQEPTAVLLTSGGEAETSGLKELIERCHATVVAPPAVLRRLRDNGPSGAVFLSTDELPARGWFAAGVVPLRAGDLSPIAYRLEWAGKSVLLSGRIPGKIKDGGWPEPLAELVTSRGFVVDFLISVNKLAEPRPDLWLPAVPVDGQNANLYDHDWEDVITASYQVGNAALARIR